jgi:hypothetical protein
MIRASQRQFRHYNYHYYYVIRSYVLLLAYANGKTRRVNKMQIKHGGYRNKNGQSDEDNCSGKETFKLRSCALKTTRVLLT